MAVAALAEPPQTIAAPAASEPSGLPGEECTVTSGKDVPAEPIGLAATGAPAADTQASAGDMASSVAAGSSTHLEAVLPLTSAAPGAAPHSFVAQEIGRAHV